MKQRLPGRNPDWGSDGDLGSAVCENCAPQRCTSASSKWAGNEQSVPRNTLTHTLLMGVPENVGPPLSRNLRSCFTWLFFQFNNKGRLNATSLNAGSLSYAFTFPFLSPSPAPCRDINAGDLICLDAQITTDPPFLSESFRDRCILEFRIFQIFRKV